ncbi:lipase maturation factor family protein [Mycobacterium xenopi 3993]|nr:lipase maturation factor family protein [Mycobacterium xenopi 3993]
MVPFGLFAPQPVASMAGAVVVITQLWLVISGNFAWLNWLTILLGCSVIDDSSWSMVLPVPKPPAFAEPPLWFAGLVIAFTALSLFLSYWPMRNMMSRHQRMNMSFNPFHLVNTYGAFGSIGRIRNELIVEGTDEPTLTEQTVWREYEFKGKPGAVRRLPRQWAPYHLRLDWLMWFAAISPLYAERWLGPSWCGFCRTTARHCACCVTTHSPVPRHGTCACSSTSTATPHFGSCCANEPGGIVP